MPKEAFGRGRLVGIAANFANALTNARKCRLILFAALALLSLRGGPAMAADIFSVSGIEVDVSAESAVDAQGQAIAEAQRIGLGRLLQKLTIPAYHDQLPDTSGIDASSYARSHMVEHEQVAATRYVATMLVSYDGERVRKLVEASGVPMIIAPSDPLLVLPAIERDGTLDFWSEDNPWREAWSIEAERGTLLDIRLPLGDLSDVATLSTALRRPEIPEAVAALATRYNATSAIVVVARPTTADVDVASASDLELYQETALAWPYHLEGMRVATPPGNSGTVWRQAARRVMSALEGQWKPDHLVRVGRPDTLSVSVPLADLQGWAHIRSILNGVPEIQSVAVNAFSQSEASLRLAYIGGQSQLDRALESRGLRLQEETNRWLLLPAEGRSGGRLP